MVAKELAKKIKVILRPSKKLLLPETKLIFESLAFPDEESADLEYYFILIKHSNTDKTRFQAIDEFKVDARNGLLPSGPDVLQATHRAKKWLRTAGRDYKAYRENFWSRYTNDFFAENCEDGQKVFLINGKEMFDYWSGKISFIEVL